MWRVAVSAWHHSLGARRHRVREEGIEHPRGALEIARVERVGVGKPDLVGPQLDETGCRWALH